MDTFQYAQGFVKGLSPFEYRGKNPDFYKQRHRETATCRDSYEVEAKFKFLVPSKWHKTGWKYTEIPKSTIQSSPHNPDELQTTYSLSFQSPRLKMRQTSHIPRNSFSRPSNTWKLSPLRLSL